MSPFYVWETFFGCVVDGVARLPEVVRVGWPAVLMQSALALTGSHYMAAHPDILTPLQMGLVLVLYFYVIAVLYAPVYNTMMYRAATGSPATRSWFTYRINGKALACGMAFPTGMIFMSIFVPVALAPGLLALSAEAWIGLRDILDTLIETFSIVSFFDGSVTDAVKAVDDAVPLEPSAIGAGVLLFFGSLLIVWMNTKLTYIVPLAAFQGQFFPYINSFVLSRVRFGKLLFTKTLLLTFLIVVTFALFAPIFLAMMGFAGIVAMATGVPLLGVAVMWAVFTVYCFWILASLSSFHGRLYGLHIVVDNLFEKNAA